MNDKVQSKNETETSKAEQETKRFSDEWDEVLKPAGVNDK